MIRQKGQKERIINHNNRGMHAAQQGPRPPNPKDRISKNRGNQESEESIEELPTCKYNADEVHADIIKLQKEGNIKALKSDMDILKHIIALRNKIKGLRIRTKVSETEMQQSKEREDRRKKREEVEENINLQERIMKSLIQTTYGGLAEDRKGNPLLDCLTWFECYPANGTSTGFSFRLGTILRRDMRKGEIVFQVEAYDVDRKSKKWFHGGKITCQADPDNENGKEAISFVWTHPLTQEQERIIAANPTAIVVPTKMIGKIYGWKTDHYKILWKHITGPEVANHYWEVRDPRQISIAQAEQGCLV